MNYVLFSDVPVLRLIGINAGVLFVLDLIMEVNLRFFGKNYGNSPADADPVVHYVHPANYYYKMFSPSGEFGGYSIYFDRLRRRAQVPELAIQRHGNAPTIVFLGDSFTKALQVPYDSMFIGILSTRFPQAAIPSRYKNFTGDLSRELFAEKTEAAFDSTYRQKPSNFFYSKDVYCNANGHKEIASVFSKIVGKFIQ